MTKAVDDRRRERAEPLGEPPTRIDPFAPCRGCGALVGYRHFEGCPRMAGLAPDPAPVVPQPALPCPACGVPLAGIHRWSCPRITFVPGGGGRITVEEAPDRPAAANPERQETLRIVADAAEYTAEEVKAASNLLRYSDTASSTALWASVFGWEQFAKRLREAATDT